MTAAVTALSYERTVDRRTVHRWALSEVFLTDLRTDAPDHFLVAAQLPPAHAYYCDCVTSIVDSMLLMECCRQAGTYIAHRGLGVPEDASFLVLGWTMRLHRPVQPGPAPGRLCMDVSVPLRKARGGQVRGARLEIALAVDDVDVGEVAIDVAYTPAGEAAAVRLRHRTGAPPSSADLPAVPPGTPVTPALVGRRDIANVVLTDSSRTGNGVSAFLGVRPDHRSLFDHPHDHYPAMILMEAARQAALLRMGANVHPVGYEARFLRFVELDAPVLVEGAAEEGIVQVAFRQRNAIVAEIAVMVKP